MSKWPVIEIKHNVYDTIGEKWFHLIEHIMEFANRFDDPQYILRDIIIALLENMLGSQVEQVAILVHSPSGEKVIKWIVD